MRIQARRRALMESGRRQRKNLLNINRSQIVPLRAQFTEKQIVTFTYNNMSALTFDVEIVDSEVVRFTTKINYYSSVGFPLRVSPNTQYTLSGKTGGADWIYCSPLVAFYDNSRSLISRYLQPGVGNVPKEYTFTTPANCTWIIVGFNGGSAAGIYTVREMQLELGGKRTDYEPYIK